MLRKYELKKIIINKFSSKIIILTIFLNKSKNFNTRILFEI